jgi:hypothetical protein
VDLELEILEHIKAGWSQHVVDCPNLPKAILLNPGNYALLGWHEVLGLPVLPDHDVEPKRFKLVCGTGRGGYCDAGAVIWDDTGDAFVYVSADAVASERRR